MRISTLLGTGAAVTAASVTRSIATAPAVQSDWYAELAKPAYQPPRQAFPIVWPPLYADIAAVSAATIDELNDRGKVAQRRSYVAALVLNLVLNAGWSWLFFNRRRLGPATAVSAALAASSADLARRAVAVRGVRAVPLVLYPLWVTFATVLSGHIAVLNRRR
ncbi:TspO/MBR family protein [Mycobacterium sp. UM_Kg27]|uniref:TspO/MBR family protein n=1 Tax=Mycobacterium sp. UM_Kg27 TaxID=1545693 RepID=UPI00061B0A4B|nr:TspO/MBR family protein [Mycobacterium sp. UM_Kg27]